MLRMLRILAKQPPRYPDRERMRQMRWLRVRRDQVWVLINPTEAARSFENTRVTQRDSESRPMGSRTRKIDCEAPILVPIGSRFAPKADDWPCALRPRSG